MNIFPTDTHIDFLRLRRMAFALSTAMVIVAASALLLKGLHLGLDFTGGALVEIEGTLNLTAAAVRDSLDYHALAGMVQAVGSESRYLVRLDSVPNDVALAAWLGGFDPAQGVVLLRQETVGPQFGEELARDGGMALIIATGAVLVYVAARFEWKLATGAVVALAHDTLITVGLFALMGWPFDQTTLAALLAVIGYSINDSIVVLDRIRENFRRVRGSAEYDLINAAINQTLSRTVLTSGTTLLVVACLWALGSEATRGFAIALFVGIGVGTYSSIYVAAAAAYEIGLRRTDLLVPEPPDPDLDDMEIKQKIRMAEGKSRPMRPIHREA